MPTVRLSDEEVVRCHRDGQLTPQWRLPGEFVSRMQDSLARLIAARPDLRPDFIPLPLCALEFTERPNWLLRGVDGVAAMISKSAIRPGDCDG